MPDTPIDKSPVDVLLDIPAQFKGRDKELAERSRSGLWGTTPAPEPKLDETMTEEPRSMRRTAAARDRRADAVKAAVADGADTFQKLRTTLADQEMTDSEIRSGINRALELRWIKQNGRRYTRDV